MINMITSRSELYQRIWEDYIYLSSDNKQDSFFYKYLKDKKEAAAERISESADSLAEYCTKKKRDKYTLLRSAYRAYQKSVISVEEYIALLTELAGAKWKKYEPLSPQSIDEVEQAFEKTFLLGCINDFFYNMGYRVRDNKEKNIKIDPQMGYEKTGERYLKEKDGYIDDLELWSKYYLHILHGESQPPKFISDLTDEYIQKCKQVFDVLNQEGRSNSFLPLYFDVTSGAGVIVIGNEWLSEEEKTDKACRICIMYFSDPIDVISGFDELDIRMTTELYDNFDEAFRNFRDGIAQFNYTINYTSLNYVHNNDNPPGGVDSIFSCFFIEASEEATAYGRIIQKGSQAEKNDFVIWQKEKDKANERMEHLDITK